jgi:Flp pilus assembly protein TadG
MNPRRDEGNATIELLLVAPLLLALIALVIGAGRLLSIQSGLESVVRESARFASQADDAWSADTLANERAGEVAMDSGLDPARLRVEVEVGAFGRGDPLTVRANYDARLSDLPGFGLLPGSFQVSAHHVERVEKFKSR